MLKQVNKTLTTLFAVTILLLTSQGLLAFESPTKKVLKNIPQKKLEEALNLRKIPVTNKILVDKLTNAEVEGFVGYYGDNIDYIIYQDVIKILIRDVMGVPVREDFHFLAIPLDPKQTVQSKDDLHQIFTNSDFNEYALKDATLPLNFSLYDNFNRLGHFALENAMKNDPVKSMGYERRLKWLFGKLGIAEKEIANIFKEARATLNAKNGVILQVFDLSDNSYDLAKKIAYPSYPNGYISRNVTVDEYLLEDRYPLPYPHEVRVMLNNSDTLNPNKKLKIVRHVPNVSNQQIVLYETKLKTKIKGLVINKTKGIQYKSELVKTWGNG